MAEVERLTVTPPIVTSAVALAVYSPVAKLLMVSVQVAVLPLTTGVPQVSLCDAGAGLTAVEMTKLEGATGPRAVATTVKVCVWPISFTPLGVMLTAASTYFFVAGPAERAVSDVASWMVLPSMVTDDVALATNVPTVELLMVSVHVRLLPVPEGVAQVSLWLSGVGETLTEIGPKDGEPEAGAAETRMVKM